MFFICRRMRYTCIERKNNCWSDISIRKGASMQNIIRLFSPEEDRFTGKIAEFTLNGNTDRIYFLLTRQASDSEILTTYELTEIKDGLYELIFFYLGYTHVVLADLQNESFQEIRIAMDHMRDRRNGILRFL